MLCSIFGIWDDGMGAFEDLKGPQESRPVSTAESYFEEALFYIWKNREPILKLQTNELVFNQDTHQVLFLNPSGTIFSFGEDIAYSGKKGVLKNQDHSLFLSDEVAVEMTGSTV